MLYLARVNPFTDHDPQTGELLYDPRISYAVHSGSYSNGRLAIVLDCNTHPDPMEIGPYDKASVNIEHWTPLDKYEFVASAGLARYLANPYREQYSPYFTLMHVGAFEVTDRTVNYGYYTNVPVMRLGPELRKRLDALTADLDCIDVPLTLLLPK